MRQAGTFGRLCRVLKAICLLALEAGAAHAEGAQTEMFDRNTPIQTVLDDPAFGDYGRLLFPVDAGYFSGNTLGNLRLTWYSHIDPDETVEIVNTLRNRVLNGEIIFYDIYTEAEKATDPDKRDTGLFFFKGTPGAKFAVCNAGGGFAYVGAMHDSFPHALELSKKGYNAFALIYRPGAQTACDDLARRSASSLKTLKCWKWIPAIISSGAVRQADAWRRGSAPTVQQRLARLICRGLPPSSCNTPATANTASLTRPPLPAWVTATALPAGG